MAYYDLKLISVLYLFRLNVQKYSINGCKKKI